MSASATVVAQEKSPALSVVIRLADAASLVAYVSTAFALGLLFFPVSFPDVIVRSSQEGRLTTALIVFTLLLDSGLYLRVAHRLSFKPRLIVAASLGCLPIFIVVGLSVAFESSVSAVAVNYSNASARIAEEILAHTYFSIVAAIFLPFLLIRVVQQFHSRS
jgi:hypothetical protein